MNRIGVCLIGTLVLMSAALFVSCSNQPTQQQRQQEPASAAAPAAQPTAPASQPAQPAPGSAATQPTAAPNVSAGKPSGPLAREKHTLLVNNYAQAAVTATLNGAWVGQWDTNTNVPLDSVVQGKNELKIDLGQQPNNQVSVEVYAERGGQNVNLLRLNFQGKPAGSYTYYFAAR